MGCCFGKNNQNVNPSPGTNTNPPPCKQNAIPPPSVEAGPPKVAPSSETSSTVQNSVPEAPLTPAKPSPEVGPPEGAPISEPSQRPESPSTSTLEGPSPGAPRSEEPKISEPSAVARPLQAQPIPEQSKPEAPSPPVTAPPQPRNSKRALLCGVSYKNSKDELKGTINDVKEVRSLLIEKFQFRESNMRILTEQEENQDLIPTRKNIIEGLQWLVKGCSSGDSLVFYFAGHGVQKPDPDNEERDHLNEAICPTDYEENGVILDNEINSIIVWPLKKGVKLHAIIDSCHSGTMLDLLYIYNRDKKKWVDNSPPSGAKKVTEGGWAISISACQDSEEAADSSENITGSDQMNGPLTYFLIQKVKEFQDGIVYGQLLDFIHQAIDDLKKDGCLPRPNLFRRFFGKSQRPQLSSSETFDVYSTLFQV